MYRRVPEDWIFPNKMTLRTAFHRYFLFDHKLSVCPLKNLTSPDMAKQPNGKRNLSNLKRLMQFMVRKLKSTDSYINEPREKEVNDMFRKVSGHVFALSNTPRAEMLSWHTHVRKVNKAVREEKNKSN